MLTARPRQARLLGHDIAGPALIAHGGGNAVALAGPAISDGADYVEVDLWVHRGLFEARHERRFFAPVPVLYERWYLRHAPRVPFDLRQLLTATADRTGIFLDLKNGGDGAAGLVREALDGAHVRGKVVASSQHWPLLRSLHQAVPEVDLYYSIDVRAKLDLFFSVMDRDPLPAGVSCRHTLLDAPTVDRLHERGLQVVAWTVDDRDTARTLVEAGVDGLTTHHVRELRAAFRVTG